MRKLINDHFKLGIMPMPQQRRAYDILLRHLWPDMTDEEVREIAVDALGD